MLQTFLWSRMTCSTTVLKYPLAVLAQTPAAYILMYCNAFSTTSTAVRCFQLRKKVLRLYATSYQSSERTVQRLTQGGRTTMITMPVNRITSQCKIKLSQKYCPWINLQLWNFCHFFLQWMGIFFLDYYVLLCNTCLYRSVHRHGYHFHSSPLAEVRIPRSAAARAHFVVINKGAGQFYLSFDTR